MPSTGDNTNLKMSPPEQAFDGKDDEIDGIRFVDYEDESQLDRVMSLVGRDLSEPYSSEHCTWFAHYIGSLRIAVCIRMRDFRCSFIILLVQSLHIAIS